MGVIRFQKLRKTRRIKESAISNHQAQEPKINKRKKLAKRSLGGSVS